MEFYFLVPYLRYLSANFLIPSILRENDNIQPHQIEALSVSQLPGVISTIERHVVTVSAE